MKANPSRIKASSLILVVSLIVVTAWETTLQARQNQPPPAAAADVQLWAAALEQLQREQNKDFALANETLPSSDFASYLRNVTREQDLVDKLLKRNESSPGFINGVASSTTELIDVTAIRKPGAQDIDWIDLGRQSRLRKSCSCVSASRFFLRTTCGRSYGSGRVKGLTRRWAAATCSKRGITVGSSLTISRIGSTRRLGQCGDGTKAAPNRKRAKGKRR